MKTTKGVKVLVALPLILFPLVCDARVTGQCGHCHTMHFSQGGAAPLDVKGNTAIGPNDALLNINCIGCHTGPNAGGTAATNTTPYVLDIGAEPTTKSLAGGNFWWVENVDDTRGHNIISTNPDALTTPPGWNSGFNANTIVNNAAATWTVQLTCAGSNGCHGKHAVGVTPITNEYTAISGAHHTNDSTIDGSTTGKSYRFLYGIIGYEDPDWEYTTGAANHNQYYGYDRTSDTPPAAAPEKRSINYLCAECHGDFHSGTGDFGTTLDGSAASPWIRHPTDFDMNGLAAGSEYKSYGDGGVGVYNPLVPLATDRIAALVDPPVSNVFATNGDAIVSCISCHRAHGSPYDDLLRWNYKAWPGGGDNGCAVCHTSKN
jgi:predicted CXXCH cytochrome family protein